jgi:tetratricopeptide (TPR) repeat protein
MALPLSLLFYQPGFNNMLTFVVSFELIFLGLILTGGRATMLATGVTVFLMSGYIAISHNPIIGLVTIIAPIFIYALTNKGQKYFERVKSSLLRMRQGKESRYLLWKEAIGFAFAKPLLGVGIENVGNLFRQKGSKKMASAMKDRVTDRTHNYFLDLWLEGGLPYLAVFLILCGVAINNYFTSPYPFAAIAIIAFMVDVFFSFPLQINYLTIMLLIACSGGVFAFAFPAWILLFFIPLFAFNYMKALKTNEATRYIQAGLGFLKQNDTYNAFAMFDSALTIAPDEERFYNLIGHLMYDMVGSGPQQISIFRFFSSLLNGKQKLIINNSPGGDKAYAGVGLLNIAIYKANGNEQAKEAALECTELILKKNPNSFCATRIKLILYWHEKEYEKYQKLVERAIYDCIDGNPNNEIDEQNLWNLYFQAAKETNKRTLDGLFLSRCEKGAIKCEKVK